MSIRSNSKQGHRHVRLAAVAAVAGVLATACGSGSQTVARADANREIIVNMDEFSFGLDVIELTAGETVTFVLVNLGDNEHEFMIGRNVQDTSEGYPNGFEHDFFETATPTVDPPSAGMNMGADMGGMDMSGDAASSDMPAADMPADGSTDMAADTSTDMGGMDMSGDNADMPPADMPADDHQADAGGDGHDAGGEPGMDTGGDAHSGFMVQRAAGEVARLTVTVPNDVLGEWEIGCFRGRGSHWDAGMRAKLIVSEA